MKRKITLYFMIVILLTLGLVMLGFGIGIKKYYYQGIANTFQNQAEVTPSVWTEANDYRKVRLIDYSDEIIKKYQYKDAELQLLDKKGRLIQSSTGFYVEKTYQIDPSIFHGKTTYKIVKNVSTDEKIMDLYTPLVRDKKVVGVLRYTTSLTKVNYLIMNFLKYGFMICLVVAIIVFLLSLQLGNSIVRPLNEIIYFTKKMAEDQFKKRIDKKYPYELGDLERILNHMADEIVKSDGVKNDFISSISHELRTPLTGIKGWTETMKEPSELSKEELKFGLSIIEKESERLISLVENLLDFSRYQSNRIILSPSLVQLEVLIQEAIFQLQKKADQKEINVSVETTPVNTVADSNKLKQVILNILDNAIKFSKPGGNIRIKQMVRQDKIVIEISDDGIGIKKEDLGHVMETFYKINQKSNGAGLGLAITKNIIDMHQGSISIQSEYEKGTNVIIILPLNDNV